MLEQLSDTTSHTRSAGMLTEDTVRASDRRAQFVGVDAYEAAGGVVMRDLFEHDEGGWLQDPALLDRLVTEKLKAEAEAIAAEGWKWIAVAVDFPYGHTNGLRRLDGEPAELTEEERATLRALNAEYDRLETGIRRTPTNCPTRSTSVSARSRRRLRHSRLDRSSTIRPTSPAPASSSASTPTACCSIDRGYVRPEDEAPGVDPMSEHEARERPDRRAGEPGTIQARRHHGRRRAGRASRRGGGRWASGRCRIGSSPS